MGFQIIYKQHPLPMWLSLNKYLVVQDEADQTVEFKILNRPLSRRHKQY